MNKRIRELAEQAGFRYIKDERIGWAGNYNASLPKFAELIIQECVGIARQNNNSGEGGVIAQTIEQHFGVE